MRATALFNHVGRLNLIGRPNLIGRHVSLKKKILTKGKITCKFPLMLHAACKYLILFNKKKKFYRHCLHCFRSARHHGISRYRDTMTLYSYKTVQFISGVAISPLALIRSHQISCVCHSLDSCDVVLNSSFGI